MRSEVAMDCSVFSVDAHYLAPSIPVLRHKDNGVLDELIPKQPLSVDDAEFAGERRHVFFVLALAGRWRLPGLWSWRKGCRRRRALSVACAILPASHSTPVLMWNRMSLAWVGTLRITQRRVQLGAICGRLKFPGHCADVQSPVFPRDSRRCSDVPPVGLEPTLRRF